LVEEIGLKKSNKQENNSWSQHWTVSTSTHTQCIWDYKENDEKIVAVITCEFLAENQIDAPLLIDLCILFFNSLHVSGTMCPSSGETKLY
jgi:hypothetical protein